LKLLNFDEKAAMPKKGKPVSWKNKKAGRKKINLTRLFFILIAIIIALAFLMFSLYTSKRNKPINKQSSSYSKPAPTFRKDGRLLIMLTENPGPILLDIEIADNDEERMRGLMDRQTLPDNTGMLFIFPNDEPRSFWMKNTYISLDIIYINSSKEIVSIQKYTQPKSTYSIPSEKPAMYVLEVNAGFTDKYGINPGDKIDFSH
jgi:uncharacterized membrane protein (UPF0127 family)